MGQHELHFGWTYFNILPWMECVLMFFRQITIMDFSDFCVFIFPLPGNMDSFARMEIPQWDKVNLVKI